MLIMGRLEIRTDAFHGWKVSWLNAHGCWLGTYGPLWIGLKDAALAAMGRKVL